MSLYTVCFEDGQIRHRRGKQPIGAYGCERGLQNQEHISFHLDSVGKLFIGSDLKERSGHRLPGQDGVGTTVDQQATSGILDHWGVHQSFYVMLSIRQRETLHWRSYGSDDMWSHIWPACCQSLQPTFMGQCGPNHPRMLTRRLGRAMLRRRGRAAQGLHGKALEIGRLFVGAGDDLWLVDYRFGHLVDDRAVVVA